MRRHVVLAFLDFDYRANALRQEVNPAREEKVRELHLENRGQLIAGLREQYGGANLEEKVADFTAAGPLVASIMRTTTRFCAKYAMPKTVRAASAQGRSESRAFLGASMQQAPVRGSIAKEAQ